jgi:hypothetical protein
MFLIFCPDFHVCDFNNTEWLLLVLCLVWIPRVQYYSNDIICNKNYIMRKHDGIISITKWYY